jgi:hypothetical protein
LSKRPEYIGIFPVRPANPKHNLTTYARPLIASALIAGGLGQLALPVLAQTAVPAAANTVISNTAAASYEDEAGAKIETASNTVTIKVAKVAGIYVKDVNFTKENGSTVFQRSDVIYANFDVKNTGNDGVKFKVPKLASVVGAADFGQVEYLAADGITWTPVTDANGTNSQTIAVDGILKVRVKLTVKSTAADLSDIVVTLGQTKTPGAINLKRGEGVGEDIDDNDINTFDVQTADGTTVKVDGDAANGIREASAQQKVQVNAPKQAVPSIVLTSETPVVVAGTNKDDVNYNIAVTVAKTDVNGADNADLAPTVIKLNTDPAVPTTLTTGTNTPRVIVALPLAPNTTLKATPTPPSADWKVVYAVATGDVGVVVWSTTPPALGDVKQVGFIYAPTGSTATTGVSLPASTTPYTGFIVPVTTTGVGTVAATASVYGTTPKADGTPDPTKPVKADEGDLFTTTRLATPSPIYNGPVANPEARGPGGDQNTDFTNKSVTIPIGDAKRTDGTTLDITAAETSVRFNNSVLNTNPGAADIYLLPTVPANATDLPNGSKVVITNTDGSDSREYMYVITGVVGAYTTTSTSAPIKLSVGADKAAGYKVDLTLPAGIKQLTGYQVPITAFTGGTITGGMVVLPVAAAATTGPNATAETFAPTAKNITIDRAYTGFIDLVKEVRVLDSIAQQNDPDNGALTYYKGTVDAVKAVPGKFIQYRIRAVNISTPADASATDSQLLNAKNLQIVEDGNIAGGNNWATTTTHESTTAKTVNVVSGSPVASTITRDGGKSDSQLDINVYTVKLTDTIAPGASAAPAFVFIRKVTAPDGKLGTTLTAPTATTTTTTTN